MTTIDPEVASIIRQALGLVGTLGTAYIYARWHRPPDPPKRSKRRPSTPPEDED